MRSTAILFAMLLLLLTQVGCVLEGGLSGPHLFTCLDPGLAIIHSRRLEQIIAEDHPGDLEANVYFGSEHKAIWIPLIHLFYDHGPYRTSVHLEDASGENQSIEINEVVIEYKNGEVIREQVLWTGGLPEVASKDGSDEAPQKPVKIELAQTLTHIDCKYASGKLTVRGHLIKPSGERVEFQTTKRFHTDTTLRVYPNWFLLSGA